MSIGEFARASGLTPKALRLYDELGLLPPASVDPDSGYRGYDPAQLDRARLIAALRGVGMPLARIRVVGDLPAGAAAVEIRSWWRQAEADATARAEQVHLLVDDLVGQQTSPMLAPPALRSVMTTGTALPHLDHGARTYRGLVRDVHQDVAFAGSRLFAVADGFGAPDSDRTAARAAVDAMSDLDGADESADLGAGFSRARAAVAGLDTGHVGTTLTAVLWSGGGYAVAHVGDSRLYLLRGGSLSQVTHDHTYVRSLVEEGKLTPDEAAVHPERATLLRALTARDPTEPDLHLRDASPGDRLLLCTDGLHAVVGEDVLHDVLTGPDTADRTTARLVEAARDSGAPDNVACVVIDVVALGE